MSILLTRRQVRELDTRAIADYGMSGLVLMENAGRGCADVLRQIEPRGPVAIACGKGNNGGDGFVIARHLDNAGIDVRVLLFCRPMELAGEAAINFSIINSAGLAIEVLDTLTNASPRKLSANLERAAWIVDALLGTGSTGAPRPPLDSAIRILNAHPARKLAIDLPSGLDCDTGAAADPTFRADHTCTFVGAKPGLVVPRAQEFVGTLHVIDIGVPRRLISQIAGGMR
jgi:NAD(P)H-hydrate epimerase